MSSNDKENNPALDLIKSFKEMTEKSTIIALQTHENRAKAPEALRQFYLAKLKLDTWKLFDEAIPFSIGAEISEATAVYRKYSKWLTNLRQQIEASINVSLELVNPQDKRREWRVTPKNFIKWLIEKELVPFSMLKELYESSYTYTGKKLSDSSRIHGNTEANSLKREQVLAAALAVLARYPDECIRGGKVNGAKITTLIEQKSQFWFGHEELPLSNRVMTNLINKALNSIPD